MMQHHSKFPPAFVSSSVECPCDIPDALSSFLVGRSAKDSSAFVLGQHMVCIAPDEVGVWPIDPEDLATAQDVIARELEQIVLWQEENRLTPARLVAKLRREASTRESRSPELARALRLLAETYGPGAAKA